MRTKSVIVFCWHGYRNPHFCTECLWREICSISNPTLTSSEVKVCA
ncbi:MAG: hypothetical protein NDF55_08805 [archaeon GB-1867-005]|nr:hypothetical protein [Candidatus Culexmicrobium cathedralense]